MLAWAGALTVPARSYNEGGFSLSFVDTGRGLRVGFDVLKGLALALTTFCAFLVLHVAIFRLRPPVRRFDAMVRMHWLLIPVLCVAYVVTPPDLGVIPEGWPRAGWLLDLVNGIIVYDFLFVGYSMFYFLIDRGFSSRILIEIDRSPGGALTQEQVEAVYAPEQIVGRRLGELLDMRSVMQEGDRLRITPRGLRQSRLFAFVKSFFNLGLGG